MRQVRACLQVRFGLRHLDRMERLYGPGAATDAPSHTAPASIATVDAITTAAHAIRHRHEAFSGPWGLPGGEPWYVTARAGSSLRALHINPIQIIDLAAERHKLPGSPAVASGHSRHTGFTGDPVAPLSRSGPMVSRKSYCLFARQCATSSSSRQLSTSTSPMAAMPIWCSGNGSRS
jgi:hypothetical protein